MEMADAHPPTLPEYHPQRFLLNDEVHSRPPEAITAPTQASYLVLFSGSTAREQIWQPVSDLANRFSAPPPSMESNHYSADLGSFRVKWERHTEFSRYTFFSSIEGDGPFAEPVVERLPGDWISSLPGQTMLAAHAAFVPDSKAYTDHEELSKRFFAGNVLIGSKISGGSATALTDFRIHGDGFSRLLMVDHKMTPWQAGRMMQRLLEIDTYRIMALLAFPVARELTPFLTQSERELAQISTTMATASDADEPILLDRLTKLAASIESRYSDNRYRFNAASAYYELVQRRIDELREERIEGLQTLKEFTERRLAPAMNTCLTVASRQTLLSEGVARATQLLSTRVDITHERQNQAMLESLDRRAKLQLRLQQTVEGLSVAAITYYVVGLVGYAAKGLQSAGIDLNTDVVVGLSIPFVALFIALGVKRVRRMIDEFRD